MELSILMHMENMGTIHLNKLFLTSILVTMLIKMSQPISGLTISPIKTSMVKARQLIYLAGLLLVA